MTYSRMTYSRMLPAVGGFIFGLTLAVCGTKDAAWAEEEVNVRSTDLPFVWLSGSGPRGWGLAGIFFQFDGTCWKMTSPFGKSLMQKPGGFYDRHPHEVRRHGLVRAFPFRKIRGYEPPQFSDRHPPQVRRHGLARVASFGDKKRYNPPRFTDRHPDPVQRYDMDRATSFRKKVGYRPPRKMDRHPPSVRRHGLNRATLPRIRPN